MNKFVLFWGLYFAVMIGLVISMIFMVVGG